jgi:hypothetical protein
VSGDHRTPWDCRVDLPPPEDAVLPVRTGPQASPYWVGAAASAPGSERDWPNR